RGEEPERVARDVGAPFGHRGAGAIGDGDQPFATAFALQDQEGLVADDGIAWERDEFGGAEARAVEQFDQSGEADGESAAFLAAPLDLGEEGVDRLVVEDLGQRALAGRAGERGGRVVGPVAFVGEEAEEAAKGGRLAGEGGAAERKPGLAEALQFLRRGARKRPFHQLGGAAEVALIGEQGVAGGPGFGGHHLEEGGDQLAVLARERGHSRLSASAAIIRASYSRPTWRRARTMWKRCSGGTPAQSPVCMPTAASKATVPSWPLAAAESMIRVQALLAAKFTPRSAPRSLAAPPWMRSSPANAARSRRERTLSLLSSLPAKVEIRPELVSTCTRGAPTASRAQAR